MKKYLKIIIILLVFIPFINVNALNCYETSFEQPIEITGDNAISNFQCTNVEGEIITFKHNESDYSKYFNYEKNENNITISIIDNTINFESNIEVGIVVVSDGKNSEPIYIKNNSYVKPSETTTTSTKSNDIIYTITLDQNDGSEETTKTCSVKTEGDTCSITLPNLDKTNFSGWGKAATCKEGSIGSIKVNEDTKYYACYKNNENISNDIVLKKLNILNADNEEVIDFGTFSIKKTNYEFKVLNEVENLKINTEADEDIKVEVTGNENLVVGENEIIIKLTDSNNNNIKEYKLLVTRLEVGETINNINYLQALVIGNVNLDFNKEKFVYDVTIPNDLNKLEINAAAEDEDSTVEILGNENLIDGSSISINVANSEGNITTYTINITKEASNNFLLIAALGVITILIILLIILIIVKTKKNKNEKTSTKSKVKNQKESQNENNIEVLKF